MKYCKKFLLLVILSLGFSHGFLHGVSADKRTSSYKIDPVVLCNEKMLALEQQSLVCDFSNNIEKLLPKSKKTIIACALANKEDDETMEMSRNIAEDYLNERIPKLIQFSKKKKNVFFHAIKTRENKIVACMLFFTGRNQTKAYIKLLHVHPKARNNKQLKEVLVFSIFKQLPIVKKILNKKKVLLRPFQSVLEKKKAKLERVKASFDFTSNFQHLLDAQETLARAFFPHFFACDGEKEKAARKDILESSKIQIKKTIEFSKKKKAFYHAVRDGNGKVIAFALFFPTKKAHKVHLDVLAVHPDCQGLGLGTLMIFSIFEKYPQVKKIILDTAQEDNEKTIGFYEHLGCVRDFETDESIVYRLRKKDL